MSDYKLLVYNLARKIPKGKVSTYGLISKELKMGNPRLVINPRMVGWALHANNSDSVSCYRVVNLNGRLAKSFAFGGWQEQKRRLESEGIKFKDEMHVDLEKHLWKSK